MTFEIVLVLTILAGAVACFATERLPVDLVALGILPLGLALEKTGAARLLSSLLVDTIGAWGPVALLSAFYLLTSRSF